MHIHREGIKIIIVALVVYLAIAVAINWFYPKQTIWHYIIYFSLGGWFIWIVSFFRVPHRIVCSESDAILSSADGRVVVVEEVVENEYFKDKRIQVSVFMSPFNVHVNWFPFSGQVSYVKYHPGKFLIAKNPKSSTDNERNTIVLKGENNQEVLVRQIAGIMARRIVCKIKVGDEACRGKEFGIIRFGSRVDFFLPVSAKVDVKIGDKVRAQKTIIARF